MRHQARIACGSESMDDAAHEWAIIAALAAAAWCAFALPVLGYVGGEFLT